MESFKYCSVTFPYWFSFRHQVASTLVWLWNGYQGSLLRCLSITINWAIEGLPINARAGRRFIVARTLCALVLDSNLFVSSKWRVALYSEHWERLVSLLEPGCIIGGEAVLFGSWTRIMVVIYLLIATRLSSGIPCTASSNSDLVCNEVNFFLITQSLKT